MLMEISKLHTTKAVEEAKAVLAKENVTQAEVEEAKAKLQEAKDVLNGTDTDKSKLQELSDEVQLKKLTLNTTMQMQKNKLHMIKR